MQVGSLSFIASLLSCTLGLNITNPPQNIPVCINNVAEINCGFTGIDPYIITPNWIMRNSDGRNETVLGGNILANLVSGFRWIPDRDSGADNAPNSKLFFGPVNETHNQSSFQCFFTNSRNQILAISSIGTITVVGPPSVNIRIDEVCVTSITLSLTIYSQSACEAFSLLVNLMSSDITISQVSNNDSTYTFNGLAPDTLYNVTVTINDTNVVLRDFQVFGELIKTRSFTSQNPIGVDTIEILTSSKGDVIILWEVLGLLVFNTQLQLMKLYCLD